MKEKIKEQLINATDEMFLEWQAKLHVVDANNDPFRVNAFNVFIDQLAEQMAVMLEEQEKLKITDIGMGDVSYPTSELAKDLDTFELLRKLQEKIEENHNGK